MFIKTTIIGVAAGILQQSKILNKYNILIYIKWLTCLLWMLLRKEADGKQSSGVIIGH